MMKHLNPFLCIDFYKAGHIFQYPKGTTRVVSNFTPRSARHANVPNKDGIINFGLQYFCKDFLITTFHLGFFSRPKAEVLAEIKRRFDTSLGKDSINLDHVAALHDLGYLPIEIKALPEGAFVPVNVPVLTIHNTKDEFFWLPNMLETVLSSYLWLACTSATTAYNYRKLISKFITLTGSPAWFADYQAHDFSFRGMSSLQAALVSGAAHLCFFKGTDTVPAIDFLEQYYGANADTDSVGQSVAATEHSVMCAGGQDNELDTFRRLILEVYPTGIVSIVSDTWDFWKVICDYAPSMHQEIMSRDGKVVFRPDSGDPVKIICGDPYAIKGTPESKGAVECLWEIFGGTLTETGHKLLDSHVGLIYGDSITYSVAEKILEGLTAKGFASANIVFGVGSYTYQYVTRDTWSWAVKATQVMVNGIERDIFKNPKTDDGTKKSHKGLLTVGRDVNGVYTVDQGQTWEHFNSPMNLLTTVFKDGKLLKETTLAEIRKYNGV